MDNKDINMKLLIDTMSVFEKIYDVIRIVNPMKKQILDLKLNKVTELEASCYSFWKKGKVCSNCVSARAYNENETFVKIEYNGEKVYMLTAIPVQFENTSVIIELLKDITNSGVIENIESKDSDTIHSVVNRMNELVISDPLTNVFNKRFINERLPVDMINSSLNGEPVSLIMVDIDFFKKVNDTYGHVAGDEVIKTVAAILSRSIRKDIDWVARYGGEEFVVYLKNTNKDSAISIAERMRKSIEDAEIKYEGTTIKVTASFGVRTLLEEQLNQEELIKEVDSKLYEAKNSGRNKIIA